MSTTHDPLKKQHRKTRKRHRLGPEATCLACGRTNLHTLRKAKRSVFEMHHVLGVSHAPDAEVVVCILCHARMSAGQVDDEVPLQPQETILERMVAVLLAWASFLSIAAEILKELAASGTACVAGLDRDYPDWRVRSWAV